MLPVPPNAKENKEAIDEFLESCGGRKGFRKMLLEVVKDFPVHIVLDEVDVLKGKGEEE